MELMRTVVAALLLSSASAGVVIGDGQKGQLRASLALPKSLISEIYPATARAPAPGVSSSAMNISGMNKLATGMQDMLLKGSATQAHLGEALADLLKDRTPQGAGKKHVEMEVEQRMLDEMMQNFSTACGEQWQLMMDDNATESRLYTFGAQGAEATEDNCAKFNGKICRTEAKLSEQQDFSGGRRLTSEMSMEGPGCLPDKCLQKADLAILATLMMNKAASALDSEAHTMSLAVDCTATGGDSVNIGSGSRIKTALMALFLTAFALLR